jgi:hypothetical protein
VTEGGLGQCSGMTPATPALDAATGASDTSAMAIDSPARPPSQDELAALIREARERQLRRRLLGAAAVAITAAASLGIYAVFTGGSSRPTTGAPPSGLTSTCPLDALPLSLQTQGTATQAVTFLTIRNPQRLRCSITASVVFAITENGKPARVLGNPLRLRLHTTLRGTKSSFWPLDGVWWANYCGPRKGLRMTARVGPQSISTHFNVLPGCLSSGNGLLRLG